MTGVRINGSCVLVQLQESASSGVARKLLSDASCRESVNSRIAAAGSRTTLAMASRAAAGGRAMRGGGLPN